MWLKERAVMMATMTGITETCRVVCDAITHVVVLSWLSVASYSLLDLTFLLLFISVCIFLRVSPENTTVRVFPDYLGMCRRGSSFYSLQCP